MSKIIQNLTSLLELPGLSKLVKGYTKVSVNIDNTNHLNRRQFQSTNHENTLNVYCYGSLVLYNPEYMFHQSTIETFKSKGIISLIGVADFMFCDARSFNSDLSKWNVEDVKSAYCMFTDAQSFNSDLNKWNVVNFIDIRYMFWGAEYFDSDLSRWNVVNLLHMHGAFGGETSFNSDLSRWKVFNENLPV